MAVTRDEGFAVLPLVHTDKKAPMKIGALSF